MSTPAQATITPPPGYTLEPRQGSPVTITPDPPPQRAPVYLDDQGNPKSPTPARTAAPVYLDDQGNPITPPPGYTLETPQASQQVTITPDPPPQGPTIGPQPKASDMPTFGESWMSPEQRLTMPLVKALIAAHDKLRDVENFTQEGRQEHPIQAKLGGIADAIEGYLIGGAQQAQHNIGTGKTGILNNPITASLIPGAEGEPAAAGAIRGGADVIKSGYQAVKDAVTGGEAAEAAAADTSAAATKGPSVVVKRVIRQVREGKGVAQAPAKAALESGAESSAQDAGFIGPAEQGNGIRTMLTKPIAAVADTERSLYDTVNAAAETDMKSLFDHHEDLLEALDDPTQISNRKALADELNVTDKAIKVHSDLAARKGVAMDTLDQAKALTQQRYSMETLDQKLFNNEGVVSGDVSHGAPESINVEAAIRQVQNLDKPSRFAPRGTPTRLVQALGKDGATKLKQGLYDAQQAGEKALSTQRWLKIAGITGGVAGSGLGVLKHALSAQ